ncbi:hypothetical protein HK099_002066 [Clydaea vesicula]|uniref:Superoxide dismutase n=1 Tax=Clydaea vesicula TaxID=447962 RepID=A0AAD5TW89_9FUNG|nr:hypothetical protein HK099_002066 [Clydaea vesicula]
MLVLPVLPYAYDDLEPFIDKQTMELHHLKHHQGYTDIANSALNDILHSENPSEFVSKNRYDMLKLLRAIAKSDAESVESTFKGKQTILRNNGGGFYNHSVYWKNMRPNPQKEVLLPKKDSAFTAQVTKDFGSVKDMVNECKHSCKAIFGSGWVFLVRDSKDKCLKLVKTANQDIPEFSLPDSGNLDILIAIDVWEHAYYIKYNNRRMEYVDAFFCVINWEEVECRFERVKNT